LLTVRRRPRRPAPPGAVSTARTGPLVPSPSATMDEERLSVDLERQQPETGYFQSLVV